MNFFKKKGVEAMMALKGVRLFLGVLLFIFIMFASNTYAGESYYPLEKGLSWTYNVSGKTSLGGGDSIKVNLVNFSSRKLKERMVVPQKMSSGSNTEFSFMVSDKSGVYEYATQKPSDIEPEIKASPHYILKFPLKVGTSWDTEHKTAFLRERVKLTTTATIESVSEEVLVPAGSYSNCIHVKKTGSTIKNMGVFGNVQIIVEVHYWYAPGIGFIKSISKEKSNNLMLGSGEGSSQLEVFTK
jgi:hypothetical protein